jgi:pimeloyl-ACP methyl ester carboxylesterase
MRCGSSPPINAASGPRPVSPRSLASGRWPTTPWLCSTRCTWPSRPLSAASRWEGISRHPERVRGLILCDTKLDADTPEARAGRAGLAAKVGRRGAGLLADTMLGTLLAQSAEARGRARRPAIEELLRQTIARQPVATIQAALAAMGERPDMTETMQSLPIPTLLVVGEEDTFTPPAIMQRMESILPDARLLIVPQAGHLVPLEVPEVFNAAVLAFLHAVAGHGGTATPDR